MTWNVVLQTEGRGSSAVASTCRRTTLAGLAAPARIAIVSLGSTSDREASALEHEIVRKVSASSPLVSCGPARLTGCVALTEPACLHVLVLLVSNVSAPVDAGIEALATQWLRSAPGRARVIPVLVPPVTFALAVPSSKAYPTLSITAFTTWSSASQVAGLVLEVALLGDRPTAFISYARLEASSVADTLHDELGRRGYRVFLDRFSGTPGRAFPQEIAEEVAEMGVVIALETPLLLLNPWTRWEIAFARLYGIGILALNFNSARRIPGSIPRHPIAAAASAGLPGPLLATTLDFVTRNRALAALRQRAMFQAIVTRAARNGGGAARPTVNAAQVIANASPVDKAVVLAAGRPGRLRDIRLLHMARLAGAAAILAGQHAHLPSTARVDVTWLAGTQSIELCGRSDVYRRVRQLARTP